MNKFEQLLDFIVNEEKEKAEELFHEIVVEKSRDIYESLIAEETAEEETAEEAVEEETEESVEEDSVEEAFGMDDEGGADGEFGGDATDDLAGDVEDPEAAGDEFGGEEGEGDTAPATRGDVQDLEDALEDLKAEFERLMGEVDVDGDGDHDMDDHEAAGEEEGEEGGEEGGEEEEEGGNPFESRQVTREYRETVGKPYGSGNGISNKNEGGDGKAGPINANPTDRPSSGATAKNIAQSKSEAGGIKGGEGLVGGKKGEFTSAGTHNVNNVKSGIKTLSKVAGGHGVEKKGAGEQAGNTKSVVDHKIG